jgi:hypothetical protein
MKCRKIRVLKHKEGKREDKRKERDVKKEETGATKEKS